MSDILVFKLQDSNTKNGRIKARIAQYEAIIDTLVLTGIKSAEGANRIEYEVDTGQTKHRVEYTTPGQVQQALKNYELEVDRLYARLQPRKVKLMDVSNFRGNGYN